jgi:hypothetical protein
MRLKLFRDKHGEKIGFMTWLYYHAHWLYRFLSGYAYDLNCQCEELCEELRAQIWLLEEQVRINELIRSKRYKIEDVKSE